MKNKSKVKILIADIETAPMTGYLWGLFDQTLGLNQIKKDWHLLSFAAKWYGDGPEKVIYHDQSKVRNIENDKKLLKKIWTLLDKCDVLITQNGIKFDIRKLNARFIMNNLPPPSSFRHIDTLKIAKKHFGFTSNKLEYMTDKLCTKYKKLKHKKFAGFELWKECLAGNKEAWAELKKYNTYDILSLEELYNKLKVWDNSINLNVYGSKDECGKCGSNKIVKRGFHYSNVGKYQRYKCQSCHSEYKDGKNLLKNPSEIKR